MNIKTLESIQDRILWLSIQLVNHANTVRKNRSDLKVGGHQTSSSSVVTILTYLYFEYLEKYDYVSIKPHASPVFHAIQYLLGNLDKKYLTSLRELHGLQSYPSRTKDPDIVDFSEGHGGGEERGKRRRGNSAIWGSPRHRPMTMSSECFSVPCMMRSGR